jgi:hypothetical protein
MSVTVTTLCVKNAGKSYTATTTQRETSLRSISRTGVSLVLEEQPITLL